MNSYTIKTPIWDGGRKTRAIGIAEFRLPCIVDISHKDKHNNLSYPGKFKIEKSDVAFYNRQTLSNSVELIIIPIEDLYQKFQISKGEKMPILHKIIKTVILAYNIEGFDEYIADKMAMEIIEKYCHEFAHEPTTADEYNDRKQMLPDFEPREDRMISVDRVMEIIDKAFDDAVPVREKHSQG